MLRLFLALAAMFLAIVPTAAAQPAPRELPSGLQVSPAPAECNRAVNESPPDRRIINEDYQSSVGETAETLYARIRQAGLRPMNCAQLFRHLARIRDAERREKMPMLSYNDHGVAVIAYYNPDIPATFYTITGSLPEGTLVPFLGRR